MSAFIKIHGLSIAHNGFIQNAVIENLASDPADLGSGRVWYNTTQKAFKVATLDGGGAVVVKAFAQQEDLQAFITDIASTAAGKGTGLVGYKGASGANNVFSVSPGTAQAALDAIIAQVDATAFNLAALGSGSITSLQNEVDVIEQSTGLNADGTYTTNLTASYINTATSLKDADNKLDTELKITSDALASETNARILADADKVSKSGDTMLGDLSMATHRITNVGTPIDPDDATNKAYVDAAITGIDWKKPVRSSTVSNITLSGLQTIDGVALVAGDRILVKDQTDATQNGIYDVSDTAWLRSYDADNTPGTEVSSGLAVFVEEGVTNSQNGYTLITDGAIVLGTTELVFIQFSGTGLINAGIGLSKTGNTLDINLGAGISELPSDGVGIDVRPGGALFLTLDGVTDSVDDFAQLSVKLDGTTLTKSGNGLRVSSTLIDQFTASDIQLQNEINAIELGAGLDTDGTYNVDPTTNYLATATSLKDADKKLDAAIKDVDTTLHGELGTLSQLHTVVKTNLVSAVNEVQDELDTYKIDVASTVSGKGAGLVGFVGASGINGNFSITTGTVGDAFRSVTTGLDAEIKARADGDVANDLALANAVSTLKTALNAQSYKFEATAAQSTYTIIHNLGTEFIDVQLWVKDPVDNKWKNDIAAITIADTNSLTIDLTSALVIRVTVRSAEDLV